MTNPLPAMVRRLDAWQRGRRPAAFVYGVVKKYGTDSGSSLAALITYYGFLSLFPLMLLAVTLVGILAGSSHRLAADLESSALSQFPIVGQQITRHIHGLSSEGGVALGVSIFGLVWGSMGGSQAAQYAMAEVWNLPHAERPGYVPRLVRSLLLLVLLAVFLVCSSALAGVVTFGAGPGLGERIGAGVASVVVDTGLFLAVFRVLTPKPVALADLLPGSVVGGIGWAVLQGLGTYLVGHQLRHANAVYGLFGLVLGVLWWIYMAAQLFLYSAEINVVRRRRLWPRGLTEPLTAADRQMLVAYASEQRRTTDERVDVTFGASEPDQATASAGPG